MDSRSRTRVSHLSPHCHRRIVASELVSDGFHWVDMDLCCFLGKDAPKRSAAELVEVLGTLIQKGQSLLIPLADPQRLSSACECRNQLSSQDVTESSYTHHQTHPASFAYDTVWDAMRYRIRESVGVGKYEVIAHLCSRR